MKKKMREDFLDWLEVLMCVTYYWVNDKLEVKEKNFEVQRKQIE